MECSIYQRQGKTQNEHGISILVSGATQETRIPHHRYLHFVNDNSTPQNITLGKLFWVTIFSPA